MPTHAPVTQNGVFDLISQSGLMAKFVLLTLSAASVFCWSIILTKYRTLSRAASQNSGFLNAFWHGKNIDEIFSRVDRFPASPVAEVFKSGVKELRKLSQTLENGDQPAPADQGSIDNLSRALSRTTNAEIAALERSVGFLATIASATPFIGLFGTVWGIMNSFQGIGASGQANLAVVAPGISEALITTAAGIGAAVPAVIAYNHFAGVIRRLANDMDCFSHDFLNIIQRSVLGSRK